MILLRIWRLKLKSQKRNKMELNDFQKRIDELVGKPENETQKMILPALVLELTLGVML